MHLRTWQEQSLSSNVAEIVVVMVVLVGMAVANHGDFAAG
jgi:hypothetical protein